MWELDLVKISTLEVVALADDPEVVAFAQRSLAGGSKFAADSTSGVVNSEFKITVNGTSLYQGSADKCGKIQAWVDDARTARTLALFGRELPYRA